MPFWEFAQNNSRGIMHSDENICKFIFIEADSLKKAISKAESLGCYWDGVEEGIDCPCCGDRWTRPFCWNDSDGRMTFPIEWNRDEYIGNVEGYVEKIIETEKFLVNSTEFPVARIFYKNGKVREFFPKY